MDLSPLICSLQMFIICFPLFPPVPAAVDVGVKRISLQCKFNVHFSTSVHSKFVYFVPVDEDSLFVFL